MRRETVPPADGEFGFSFVGGALCLDFANTVSWHAASRPYEHLRAYADLVAWARQAAVLDGERAASLLGRAEADGAMAGAVLRRALELREAIFRTCLAVRAGEPAGAGDLATVNRTLRAAMAEAALVPAGAGLAWDLPPAGAGALDWMLWPVARSAAELLTSGAAADLAICAADGCGWLFLDRTHRRRWCSMRSCGNRVKAARYYERSRRRRVGQPMAETRISAGTEDGLRG